MAPKQIFTRYSIPSVLLVLCLAIAATGQAALNVYEETHELKAKQIMHWPLRAGDSLIFRPCSECSIKTLKVTDQTQFATGFGTAAISLDELLRKKSLLRKGTDHVIAVFYLPKEHQITRLILQTEF